MDYIRGVEWVGWLNGTMTEALRGIDSSLRKGDAETFDG